MIEVALFPIPNCVAFPGTSFPLHVFEPRYRQMVQECIEQNRPMAITHTESVISEARPNQSIEESLKTNQATYKPYTIFSAGQVELLETLEDGRMMINVNLTDRLYAVKTIQTLPYAIHGCESYDDRPLTSEILSEAETLRDKVLNRLIAMTEHLPEVNELLRSEVWQNKDVVTFSFELFGIVRMDGDIQQQILQCRSPVERLNIALQVLNRAS